VPTPADYHRLGRHNVELTSAIAGEALRCPLERFVIHFLFLSNVQGYATFCFVSYSSSSNPVYPFLFERIIS